MSWAACPKLSEVDMLHGLKNWLVKWDIWPIIWPFGPKGEDGWIPAAIMAGSAIASQLGGKKAAGDQRTAEQSRIDEANLYADKDYENQLSHLDTVKAMFAPGGDFAGVLTDPIQSSSQTNEVYSSKTAPTFTGEGKASIASMLESAEAERARAESLPEFVGMEEGMARDYGQQMTGLKTALSNRAAGRGAAPMDTELEGILAGRGITGDFLGRKQQVPLLQEQARMGKNQVANMLFGNIAGLTRGSETSGKRSAKTTGEQGQGASGALAYANIMRPPERKRYV